MFVNDWSGHYGGHWHYPGTWIGQHQNPFFGWGTYPQGIYGYTGTTVPYFQNIGTHNTGFFQGQCWPQNTMSHQFNTGLQQHNLGYNYNTNPYMNSYLGQCYTPFYGNFNNPFLGCR